MQNAQNRIIRKSVDTEGEGVGKLRILAVDDDHAAMQYLTRSFEQMGYAYYSAYNGKEALDILQRHGNDIDIILLDRVMPFMNGMELVMQIHADPILRNIPIIMQTSCNDPEEVREGVEAGVFYYLTKPFDLTVLRSVMDSAAREATQRKTLSSKLNRHQGGFNMLQSARFDFRTIPEAETLACFVANCFPEPDRVITGMAELMFNAIEHGNLNIGFQKKGGLLLDGTWHEEINRRLKNPQLAIRKAELAVTRRDGGIYIVVTDQGDGFNWKSFMKIDPTRADSPHGRGIAHANAISFDKLTYNDKGNKAVAFVSEKTVVNW